jgi:hypothetical protein
VLLPLALAPGWSIDPSSKIVTVTEDAKDSEPTCVPEPRHPQLYIGDVPMKSCAVDHLPECQRNGYCGEKRRERQERSRTSHRADHLQASKTRRKRGRSSTSIVLALPAEQKIHLTEEKILMREAEQSLRGSRTSASSARLWHERPRFAPRERASRRGQATSTPCLHTRP